MSSTNLLEDILSGAEWPGNYVDGGFHPVHLGDKFNNERYRVICKLGFGKFSTVWLARDSLQNRFIALKIGAAWMYDHHIRELNIWRVLKDAKRGHPGEQHIQILLDSFTHSGPNGQHACLVFEPLGRQIDQIIEDFSPPAKVPWPHKFFREVCKQLTLGLDYLHFHSIMHRDIQIGNIILALSYPINGLSEGELEAKAKIDYHLAGTIPLIRRDGQPLHASDPKYLVEPSPLNDQTTIPPTTSSEIRILLTDLGAASTFSNASDRWHAYPVSVRPPEAVFKSPLTPAADIWNLGCVIYKLIMGENLFTVEDFGDPDETDEGQVYSFIETLGPMPEKTRALWKAADEHLDSKGNLSSPYPEDERDPPLRDAVQESKPEGMSTEEMECFIHFLSVCFRWDANERPSTKELLEHRWIADFN